MGARVQLIGNIGLGGDRMESASPDCYLSEVSGACARPFDAVELSAKMTGLLDGLRALLPVLLNSTVVGGPRQPLQGPGVTLARWIAALSETWSLQSAGRNTTCDHADRAAVVERLVRIAVGLPECELWTRLCELRHCSSAQQ